VFSIVIGTYGDEKYWGKLAQRAKRSAEKQTQQADDIILVHSNTLAMARNIGASLVKSEWLIFLDADDELDLNYIEAMTASVQSNKLLQPSTLGVVNGIEDDYPVIIPRKRIIKGNYLVIGTAIPKSLFDAVGGFSEYPVMEDWELFIRCFLNGADSIEVPDAIYRVHIDRNRESRNSQSRLVQNKTYSDIVKKYRRAFRKLDSLSF